MNEQVVLDMFDTTANLHGDMYRVLKGAVTITGANVNPEDLQTWMGSR